MLPLASVFIPTASSSVVLSGLSLPIVIKKIVLVYFRTTPLVELPLGSIQANLNSIPKSLATGANAEGVFIASVLSLLKSSFNTSICDWI